MRQHVSSPLRLIFRGQKIKFRQILSLLIKNERQGKSNVWHCNQEINVTEGKIRNKNLIKFLWGNNKLIM